MVEGSVKMWWGLIWKSPHSFFFPFWNSSNLFSVHHYVPSSDFLGQKSLAFVYPPLVLYTPHRQLLAPIKAQRDLLHFVSSQCASIPRQSFSASVQSPVVLRYLHVLLFVHRFTVNLTPVGFCSPYQESESIPILRNPKHSSFIHEQMYFESFLWVFKKFSELFCCP